MLRYTLVAYNDDGDAG